METGQAGLERAKTHPTKHQTPLDSVDVSAVPIVGMYMRNPRRERPRRSLE